MTAAFQRDTTVSVSGTEAIDVLRHHYANTEPQDVDGEAGLAINGGKGVIVVLSPTTVDVHLPSVRWVTPHTPVEASTKWQSRLLAGLTRAALFDLVTRGLRARGAQYRRCRYCGNTYPPEHRDGTVCHSCAEHHLGVVY